MSSSNLDCDSKKRKKSPSSSPPEKQHKVNYTKKRDLGTKMLTKEDLAELRRDIASDLDAKLTVKLEPVFRKVTELEAVNEQLFRMLKLNNIIIHGAQEPPAETLSTLVATLSSLWQTLGLKETAIWVNYCFEVHRSTDLSLSNSYVTSTRDLSWTQRLKPKQTHVNYTSTTT
jgi:hypothetical protein